jgi:hypothetical protein
VVASVFNRAGVAAAMAAACLAAAPAFADHQPGIVKPHSRGIPPLIDRYDASGAIIEGDWGLYRPGHGAVTIYMGPAIPVAAPYREPFYPMTGRAPRVGRHEVQPPPGRRRPPPAPSFHRSWSTESQRTVVTTTTPYEPAYEPPAVIYAPRQRSKRIPRRPQRR